MSYSTTASSAPSVKIEIEKSSPLAEAILLRAIIKGNTKLNEKLRMLLLDECTRLGIRLSEDTWSRLVIAHSSELEHSAVHVIF